MQLDVSSLIAGSAVTSTNAARKFPGFHQYALTDGRPSRRSALHCRSSTKAGRSRPDGNAWQTYARYKRPSLGTGNPTHDRRQKTFMESGEHRPTQN